ncbi:hypothetical protein [Nodularia sphaerocarpa]|uniref:hypothetical protein n=1 Tax=Nodularia sphaerocarpa TaxID=137816 RepID=UPI001EFA962F|nr:hypothetical protein [Nodularia sphaerocarpa]MDB9375905.1 hypothetical protein [Nodularia sphaerocarpa CS-585]MDB9379972.1 hypothetical protein [Nodularia sphaerocarpa CS-585A2]ULP71778.1 hypothetical protein BDGGKGIB_01412 [Nodularia sphaerocarpa UHCC 0038]
MTMIKKLTAGLMLAGGFLCLLASLVALSELEAEKNFIIRQEAEDRLLAGMILGIPLTAGGGYIFWGLRRRYEQELSDRLDEVFYHILQANHGRITVLQLAMEAKLPGKKAEEYLNQKSQEFNAFFESSNQGDITYLFSI